MDNMSKEETFLTPPNSTIKIIRNWLPPEYGNYILRRIQEEIPFAFYRRHSYNRDYDVPRGMFMFGDFANIVNGKYVESSYKYYEYGVQYPVFNWDTSLENIIIPIENYPKLVKPLYQRIYKPREIYNGESIGIIIKQLMIYFNVSMGYNYDSALINEYETGANYIASHSDNECLGSDNSVIGISLGGSRDFNFSPIIKGYDKIKTKMNHGDLMLMSGLTQNYYTHTIPRRKNADYRVSITFRSIQNK